MAQDEPHVSVVGMLALVKDRWNSSRIQLENMKSLTVQQRKLQWRKKYDRRSSSRREAAIEATAREEVGDKREDARRSTMAEGTTIEEGMQR